MPKDEFQAVVLAAGRGSRMPELIAGRPKCLLPIANKPLVWYPLQMLEKSGFIETFLIISEAQRAEVQKTLDKIDMKIKINYVCLSPQEDLGTADALRIINDKITSDIVVISCDFISDYNLENVFELFRKHDASIVSLLFKLDTTSNVSVPGPKTKHKPERDLIGLDTKTNRLVFLASSSDYDDFVYLSKRLLRKHSNISFYSRLLDSHVYVMKRWVINYLSQEKSFTTIKGELLPHIIKKQIGQNPKKVEHEKNQSVVNAEIKDDIFQFAKRNDLNEKICHTSSFNDNLVGAKPAYHGDTIRCYALQAKDNAFGIRVNTMQSYCLANSEILDRWNSITNNKTLVRQHSTSEMKSTQTDDKCLFGEGCRISEKTSIKSTFIGAFSSIEPKVRIQNSIIMNNVKIAEGCVLMNCIICDNVVIEKRVQLTDCLVGGHHTIAENSVHTNEILTASDRLMEI